MVSGTHAEIIRKLPAPKIIPNPVSLVREGHRGIAPPYRNPRESYIILPDLCILLLLHRRRISGI